MIPNFKMSESFYFSEMIKTSHEDLALENMERSVPFVFNMTILCRYALDEARKTIGLPLLVGSGFRCEALNSMVGGGANSKHKEGLAADVVFPGITLETAINEGRKVVARYAELGFNIDVVVENKMGKVWLHIEHDIEGPRLWVSTEKGYVQEAQTT